MAKAKIIKRKLFLSGIMTMGATWGIGPGIERLSQLAKGCLS